MSCQNDVIKPQKLLEAFSCFFERVSYCSNDCDNNLDKLTKFKKNIFMNLNSPAKIEELYHVPKRTNPKLVLSPHHHGPVTVPSTREPSPMATAGSFAQISDHGYQASAKEILSAKTNSSESEKSSKSIFNDSLLEFGTSGAFSYPLTLTPDEVSCQIGAASHVEGQKILASLGSFVSAKSFGQPQESVFHALCFGFYEHYINIKLAQSYQSLSDYLLAKLKYFDLRTETSINYIDGQLSNVINQPGTDINNKENVIKSFYERLSMNPNLYSSCILLFKGIIMKTLEKKDMDVNSRKTSLRWMNDLSSAEEEFYQELAELFDGKFSFIIVSATSYNEKVFISNNPERATQFGPKLAIKTTNSFTVLLNRVSGYAYILQSQQKVSNTENSINKTSPRRNKPRSFSPAEQAKPKFIEITSQIKFPESATTSPYLSPLKPAGSRSGFKLDEAFLKPKHNSFSIMPSEVSIFEKDILPQKEKKNLVLNPQLLELPPSYPKSIKSYAPSPSNAFITGNEFSYQRNLTPTGKESKEPQESLTTGHYFGAKNANSLAAKIIDEINQKVKGDVTLIHETSFDLNNLNMSSQQNNHNHKSVPRVHNRTFSNIEDAFKQREGRYMVVENNAFKGNDLNSFYNSFEKQLQVILLENN